MLTHQIFQNTSLYILFYKCAPCDLHKRIQIQHNPFIYEFARTIERFNINVEFQMTGKRHEDKVENEDNN